MKSHCHTSSTTLSLAHNFQFFRRQHRRDLFCVLRFLTYIHTSYVQDCTLAQFFFFLFIQDPIELDVITFCYIANMTSNEDYYDYSALDAYQPLLDTLAYFFETEPNPYKYSLAKKHYDDIKVSPKFSTSQKVFGIITGTSLVANKIVLSYRTASKGTRYKIKKTYLQLVQRAQRNTKRQQRNPPPSNTSSFSNVSSKSHSFAILTSPDSDDSESENEDAPQVSTTVVNPPEPESPPKSPVNEDPSISSQFTKQATALEQNMDDTLADISRTNNPQTIPNDIDKRINFLIDQKIRMFQSSQEERFSTMQAVCTTMAKDIEDQREFITETTTSIQKRMDQWDAQIINITNDSKTLTATLMDIQEKLDQWNDPNTQPSNHEIAAIQTQLQMDVMTSHSKLKKRLSKLKHATTTVLKQQEEESETLYNRIYRLEDTVAKLKRGPPGPIQTKLHFSSSDSDVSSTPQIPTSIPMHNPTTPTQSHIQRPSPSYKPIKLEPDMDYIRKNINITCTAQDQILEFYIKLRLAVAKGGIHLRPIDNIIKEQSIAQNTINKEAHQSQSNALYTILANEKYIPKDFTMAQNCILGYSTTMDGFAALKAMLKLTHPVLNKKRPSPNPPTLNDSTDIHNYEQNLRNYYLLHRLYNKTEYPAIEKSKQFLRGIEDDKYSEAVKRIQNQLDTTEIMQIDLPDDFTLDNIASSIINITEEYDDEVVVVRTANSFPYKRQPRTNHQQTRPPRTRPSTTNHNKQQYRFSNAQCHACKYFGHTINHCGLLPKVLAILLFKSKNEKQCETVLQKYIAQNSVSSKKTFVRALQQAQVLPDADDSDDLMDDDLIVHSFHDNEINLEAIDTNME